MSRVSITGVAKLAVLSTLVSALAALTGCGNTGGAAPVGTLKGTRSLSYERAITTLLIYARDPDPTLRANCVEALEVSDDPRARGVIEQGLSDSDAIVRFAAAMSVGKRKDALLKPRLLDMAARDNNTNVRVAAIYALYRMGDTKFIPTLMGFMTAKEQSVRANTYMVIGMMGNVEYVPKLKERVKPENDWKQPRAKFELTAALARLGESSAQEVISALVYSKAAEDQWNALMVCPDLPEDTVIRALLWCLNNDLAIEGHQRNLEVRRRLIAARSLAKFSKMEGPRVAMTFLQDKSPDVRALAVLALGEALNPSGEPRLTPLLDDPEVSVRIAASAAILNIWSRMAQGPADSR